MSARALVLSGGVYHPFAETSAAVAGHLRALGIAADIVSVRDGFARLASERVDLVVVNALAFSMTQAEKYAPLRAAHAFTPSDADKAALTAHMDRGGALLGLHTAAICFDGWDGWGEMLGASWVWGTSHHAPMPEYVMVGDATLWDELYCDVALAEGTRVLATATSASAPEPQPVLTVRGRAAWLALGHDLTSVVQPAYARLLSRAVDAVLPRQEAA
ncbi:hypothetical protein DXV76_18940 [Rhodobacteraceae bacterium CCMM004]|nr:hypothetical protein DXV76_18940 [Rhodobacteraceae bacterium CCMM004]